MHSDGLSSPVAIIPRIWTKVRTGWCLLVVHAGERNSSSTWSCSAREAQMGLKPKEKGGPYLEV